MDATGILQIMLYVAIILALTPLAGGYMAWIERPIYCGAGNSPP